MIENWQYYFIEDFGTISTGTTPSTKKPEFYGGPYKFISPVDLDKGKFINTSHKLVTEEGLKAGRTLPKNAILVGCIGNIGKIGMTADLISSFNQQINAIVCNESFDPDFIYYLLTFHRPLLEKSAVKTTLPILNKGNFQKIRIQAPEFPEQRKIAYVLSTIQKSIEHQDELIKTSTELKRALMQKLFTEGLYGETQKETEIGLVPKSWRKTKIRELGQIITGSTPSTKNKNFYNGDYYLISPVDLTDTKYVSTSHKKLTLEGFNKCRRLPKDAVLVGCIGNIGKIGMTANNMSASNQQINSIICNENFSPIYVFYYLLYNKNYIESKSSKVTVPILNKSNFETIELFFPKKEEQVLIAEIFDLLKTKLENIRKKKQTLKDLFKTMLHELMTGQRKVNEIDFESEEMELLIAAESEMKFNTGK